MYVVVRSIGASMFAEMYDLMTAESSLICTSNTLSRFALTLFVLIRGRLSMFALTRGNDAVYVENLVSRDFLSW